MGREVCQRQRDLIIRAMHRLCLEMGEDPAERVGSLLLAMSYVLEQVHVLASSFVMITFFDVFKCDSVLVDMFSHSKQ
uniref:MIF4G domain-containing protein n=1 Tax=Heterorhabditis bacteriophora TaxID=37862 RepID=A0A1I7XJT4_HETBA